LHLPQIAQSSAQQLIFHDPNDIGVSVPCLAWNADGMKIDSIIFESALFQNAFDDLKTRNRADSILQS
jgi:hypothetical protein